MDSSDLLARSPRVWWASPTTTLAGFGRLEVTDPGVGGFRYRRAQEGHAPISFVSFTFDEEAPGSLVVIPELTVELTTNGPVFYGNEAALSASRLGTEAPPDRPRFAGSSLPDHHWLEAVGLILDAIERGTVDKVVLARDHALWSKERFDPYGVLARLSERFPSCYRFLIEGLVGASPELLARKTGTVIESVTLAGTVGRGTSPAEDALLADEMQSDPKTLSEHRLAAEAVAATLARLAADLSYPSSPEVLKLDNVQHLATPFRGHLDVDMHILDIVSALHPTPAVGGVPTKTALGLIRQLEAMARNRYAGPVGFFRANGDGEIALALRCAELSGARARLFAGNGIVAGSVPEDELEETRLKLAAMLSALAGP